MVLNLTIAEVIAPFTRSRSIPPDKVRAFREQRGWTHEQMADEVWATPMEVAAWEAGTVRVPREQAHRMRAIAAATPPALVPAPVQPALPRCAWAEAHAPGLYEILWRGLAVPSDVQVRRHVAECSACQRVVQRDRTMPPPAPAPRRAPMDAADDLGPDMSTWEITVFFVLLTVFVAVLAAAALTGTVIMEKLAGPLPDLVMETFIGFLAFVLAGRFAGKGLPRHPYAAGLLAGVAGTLAAMLTWKLQTPDADLADPLVLALCAGVAVSVGLFRGWRLDGVEDDAAPADEEASVAAPAPVPLLTEGASLAGLDRGIGRRGQHAGASDRNGA